MRRVLLALGKSRLAAEEPENPQNPLTSRSLGRQTNHIEGMETTSLFLFGAFA